MSSQTDKDAALRWVIQQDQAKPDGGARFQRLEQLIAAGANVNKTYPDGLTPLMQAVESVESRNNESLVALLVRAGANVNPRRYNDLTVLDYAIRLDASPQCQQILVQAGAKTSPGQPSALTVPRTTRPNMK